MADRQAIHAIMCGLVARIGQTAAAHAIQAYTGADRPDYPALSRKMRGTRAWALDDMIALQAAGHCTPVTGYIAEVSVSRSRPPNIYEALAEAAREGGEGMAAVADYVRSGTTKCRAAAQKELREHREAIDRLLQAVEADERSKS